MTALVGLTEYHALAGDSAEALRAARFAVLLAKGQPSERVHAQASIMVAKALLSTRHWKLASSFLPNSRQLAMCDASCRQLASCFAAEYALRLRAFDVAWARANAKYDQRLHPSVSLSTRLVAAVAAHELQKKCNATELIEATIADAEQLGSAPRLRDAYFAAARVTGEARFARKAREITRLLRS